MCVCVCVCVCVPCLYFKNGIKNSTRRSKIGDWKRSSACRPFHLRLDNSCVCAERATSTAHITSGLQLDTEEVLRGMRNLVNQEPLPYDRRQYHGSHCPKERGLFVYMFNVPVICECISGTDLLRQTFYLTQSPYTDTGPTSPSTDPKTPNAWQG